jgi:hypothetical protein
MSLPTPRRRFKLDHRVGIGPFPAQPAGDLREELLKAFTESSLGVTVRVSLVYASRLASIDSDPSPSVYATTLLITP